MGVKQKLNLYKKYKIDQQKSSTLNKMFTKITIQHYVNSPYLEMTSSLIIFTSQVIASAILKTRNEKKITVFALKLP